MYFISEEILLVTDFYIFLPRFTCSHTYCAAVYVTKTHVYIETVYMYLHKHIRNLYQTPLYEFVYRPLEYTSLTDMLEYTWIRRIETHEKLLYIYDINDLQRSELIHAAATISGEICFS